MDNNLVLGNGQARKTAKPMSLYSLTSTPTEEPERRAGEKNVGGIDGHKSI